MKNLRIIPTDKPSRLCFRNYYFINKDNITEYSNVEFKNLYITSDEEIKEGDWFIRKNKIHQLRLDDTNGNLTKNELKIYKSNSQKIILTTDQDLITGGVQSIPDEFIEWFVKNPSCEKVEVELVTLNKHGSEISANSYGFEKFSYKIIIPKEESKQTEKMYTRKEVISLCEKAIIFGHDENTSGKYLHQINTDNWINNNI